MASIYGVPRGVPPVCAGMTVGRGPVGSRPKRAKKPPASRLSTSASATTAAAPAFRLAPGPRGRPLATHRRLVAPLGALGAPLLGDLVDGDLNSRVGPSKAAQWPPGGHGPPRGRAAARTHPRCAALTRRGATCPIRVWRLSAWIRREPRRTVEPQLRARKVVCIPLLIPQPEWDKYH